MQLAQWVSARKRLGSSFPRPRPGPIDGFPFYAQFGWGLGVWMGLAGSILLLMRHRWAVPAMALSFVGAVIGLGYQIFMAPPAPPPMNEGAMVYMPWVIIAVAGALYYYAHKQRKAGVLG